MKILDAKDPVCGMTVDGKDTNFMSSFKGNTYYFCSKTCKTDFDEDPEAVLAMKAERERQVVSGLRITQTRNPIKFPAKNNSRNKLQVIIMKPA